MNRLDHADCNKDLVSVAIIALLGSDVTPLAKSRQYPSQPRSQDLSSSSLHPGNEALPFLSSPWAK